MATLNSKSLSHREREGAAKPRKGEGEWGMWRGSPSPFPPLARRAPSLSRWEREMRAMVRGLYALLSVLGVTQTDTGTTNLPGAGLPTSTRSAVTSSPVARLKEIQGLGIRPKVIFWMGWPVAVFMIVAITLIAPR